MDFEINQIVRGKFAGRFVVLGFREISGETYAQLKEVSETGEIYQMSGELALPLDVLVADM